MKFSHTQTDYSGHQYFGPKLKNAYAFIHVYSMFKWIEP